VARKRRKPVYIQNGPWTGCFQSWDVAPEPTKELYTAYNVVFRNTQAGLAAQIRPGFQNLGQLGTADSAILCTEAGVDITTEVGGTDFLATDGHRTPQCVYQHTRVDGTNEPYLFVGGRMYRWNADPSSPVFTDMTPTTLRIDPDARVFCTSFSDRLIVNDGVNQPWTYNPATATATLIPYNTAASTWTAYGQPVVYGAKLFFILNTVAGVSARTDFIWSEEATPLVGYQQDGYDNSWTFTQTKADPLYALSATNAALYIFRQDSISAVYGAVSSAFQTTATQDAVSLTVGTTSPASVVQVGNLIYWLDRLGRPYRMTVGGQPAAIWKQLQDGVDSNIAASTLSTSQLERWGSAGYHMELGVVGFAIWTVFSGIPSGTLYMFDAEAGVFAGAWSLGAESLLRRNGIAPRYEQPTALHFPLVGFRRRGWNRVLPPALRVRWVELLQGRHDPTHRVYPDAHARR
jgi:hypothetical protein